VKVADRETLPCGNGEAPEERRLEVHLDRVPRGQVRSGHRMVERRRVDVVGPGVQAEELEDAETVGERTRGRTPRGIARDDMGSRDLGVVRLAPHLAADRREAPRGPRWIDRPQADLLVARERAVQDGRRVDVGIQRRSRPARVVEPEQVPELVRGHVLDVEAPRLARSREGETRAVEENVRVGDASVGGEPHRRQRDDARTRREEARGVRLVEEDEVQRVRRPVGPLLLGRRRVLDELRRRPGAGVPGGDRVAQRREMQPGREVVGTGRGDHDPDQRGCRPAQAGAVPWIHEPHVRQGAPRERPTGEPRGEERRRDQKAGPRSADHRRPPDSGVFGAPTRSRARLAAAAASISAIRAG